MGKCNSTIDKKNIDKAPTFKDTIRKTNKIDLSPDPQVEVIEITLISDNNPLFTKQPFLANQRLNEVIEYAIKNNYLSPFCEYQLSSDQSISLTDKSKELLSNLFKAKAITLFIQYLGLIISPDMNKDYSINTTLISIPYLDSYDPLAVAVFNKSTKAFKAIAIKPTNTTIDIFKTLSSFSGYCNGNNHLYISGGFKDEKKDNQDYSSHFISISLREEEDETKSIVNILPKLKIGRSWHKMLFIPPDYIFIVSGLETKTVEKYTISSNTIDIDSELNEIRCETSLCCVNNTFLYSFCGYLRNYGFLNSIEKCNLRKSKRTWKVVNYSLLNNCIFSPSFFPLAYSHKDSSVILFGVNETKSKAATNCFSYKFSFDPVNNGNETIDYSLDYANSSNDVFPEKMFIPIDENTCMSIPVVTDQHIKVYMCNLMEKRLSFELYSIPLEQLNKKESRCSL